MPEIFVSPQTGSEYVKVTFEEPFVCRRDLEDGFVRVRVQYSNEDALEQIVALLEEAQAKYWIGCYVKDGDHVSTVVTAENVQYAVEEATNAINKFRDGKRAKKAPTMKSYTGTTYTIYTDCDKPVFVAYRRIGADGRCRVRVHGDSWLLCKVNEILQWGEIKCGDHISTETYDLPDTLSKASDAVNAVLQP